jgi:hypothetical protein
MQNRIVRIDQIHSRAICTEVADRLRILLTKELSDPPSSLKSQIVRLRKLDQSQSIVPSTADKGCLTTRQNQLPSNY